MIKDAKEATVSVYSSIDRDTNKSTVREELNRALAPRHINMISIAGIIGTGLYLGTGHSLNIGGPGSLLISYSVVGFIVYLTLLALGEMSTFMPISGSFGSYAKKFISESFGFAILINYWFNDAVSVASDLTALQIIFEYWEIKIPYWGISLIVWFFLLLLNVIHVRMYGEAEYWLAMLKVLAIIAFFIISIMVNLGYNQNHKYIGFKNWTYGEAPFVNGFKGFATLFVSSSFAYGGTESLTLTGGEAKNPIRNTPKIIKTVIWRILIFYILTCFFIGLNVPYNYPNLNEQNVVTSPFTIVFQMIGSHTAGSFMNVVILTSIISASNHALFAGSRVLYNLGVEGYIFPRFITRTNRYGVPYVAVIITWIIGGSCFASSFIGAGTLWIWLQNLVGVSNQLAWLSILITSVRFRQGLLEQGMTHELYFKNWTYPWGVWIGIFATSVIIFVQGWSSFSPWNTSAFFSYYIQLFIFPICWIGWWIYRRVSFVKVEEMDFVTDRYYETEEERLLNQEIDNTKGWKKMRYVISDYFI